MTPITIGVPDAVLPVLPVLPVLAVPPAELELADVEEEDAELHPASARAAMATAGNAARAPVRRDRVIGSLPFLAGPGVSGSPPRAD
jgi:hypothetical protein